MSDSEEDNFQFYGTLLEPYDEDAVPKKKAFTIEDQIATDDQGRRRFHGAFTGGFSAGFFNTVGSVEGWQPSEFKSSRSEKAEKKYQKPQDFMDDEDVGEFGIAPSVVRATSDYSNKSNRKRVLNTDGPIPGIPVLQTLLQPAKDTVGIKLLKQMGWKPGQGVGPRLSKSEKRKINRENKLNSGRIYGCEIPEEFRQKIPESDVSSSEDDELTFAPDDYDPFIVQPKDNCFGMGYSGLDKRSILSSHISLFDPPEFKMRDHKNSKISVSGQAFGVGAFEQEDEDIYTRDDMSKYDFELDSFSKKQKAKKPIRENPGRTIEELLEGFVISQNSVSTKKSFPPPVLPKNFIPKHGLRVSRFEPLPENHKLFNYDRKKNMGRHDLSSVERSKIINSETIIIDNKTEKKVISVPFNTEPEKEKDELIKKAAKITQDTNFKPFVTDPDKQKRYEEYLILQKIGKDKQLHEIQPSSMADWEKERERYEFAQASRMFKPVLGLVFDKFVAASTSELDPFKPVERTIDQHGTQDMRDAAKQKMFGPLTRHIEIWIPNKMLCRRFNVPEPDITETEMTVSKKKKGKYNVFDYYEAYQQNKTVKEGPTILETVKEMKSPQGTSGSQDTPQKINTNTELVDLNTSLEKKSDTESEPTNQSNIPLALETFRTSKSIFEEESINSKISNKDLFKPQIKSFYKKSLPNDPQPIIPTDPKKKKDLFKAIFLSSSESEDEKSDQEKKKQNDDQMNEMKKIILEENHISSFDQPIINATKGIFSNLDWSKINRNPSNQEIKEMPTSTKIEESADIYGPKLPSKSLQDSSKPDKIISVHVSSSSEEEWMEAGLNKEKYDKTSKKHKKHKRKKHKSKHKKKKSKD